MIVPVDFNKNETLSLYMEPVQIAAREGFLKIVEKHGNGKWAFEELEYKVYVEHIDDYEVLSEKEKYDLNTFMISFRSLYK